MTTALVLGGTEFAHAATTVSVGDGTVSAKGVLVTVPLTVDCDPNFGFGVFLRLTQRVGGGQTAHGIDSDSILCTGAEQTVVLHIVPFVGSAAFKKGTAGYFLSYCAAECAQRNGEVRLR
jgi:hypothetical protein